MTNVTPAAVWMDRLSDRLGSLIPGGHRLPPRHPLKVSLVMMVLVAANFCPMQNLAVLLGLVLRDSAHEGLMIVMVFLGFGMLVLIPWAAWLGARLIWQILLVPYFILALHLTSQYGLRLLYPGYELRGLEIGVLFGLAGLFLAGRWRPVWLIAVIVASAISLEPTSYFLRYLMRSVDLTFHLRPYVNFPLNGMWAVLLGITPYFALMALCLGGLLWDRTPRAVLEP